MSDTPLLSRPVELAEIGEGGLTRTITADAAEREALAIAFDLRELRSLVAKVKLSQLGRTGVLAEGHISADLVQTCVVSLVPIDQTVDEDFSVRYTRGSAADAHVPKADIEVRLDDEAVDPPEIFTGSVLDLGPLIVEYLALGIDPYPRAPGAVLPPEATDSDSPEEGSPFAALAALRRDPKDSG